MTNVMKFYQTVLTLLSFSLINKKKKGKSNEFFLKFFLRYASRLNYFDSMKCRFCTDEPNLIRRESALIAKADIDINGSSDIMLHSSVFQWLIDNELLRHFRLQAYISRFYAPFLLITYGNKLFWSNIFLRKLP